MTIQNKIRLLRHQNDLTQEQLAERLHITPQAYSRIEQGKTKLSIERIQKLADIFNVDITDLILNDNDKGVFLLINENCNHQNGSNQIICNNDNQLVLENETLRLTVAHKDEIIAHLKNEITMLKQMIELLKNAPS